MVFHIIGLGLADERDITVRYGFCAAPNIDRITIRKPSSSCRGLEIVKRCSKVYLEAYTSLLLVDSTKLVGLRAACTQAVSRCSKLSGRRAQENFYGVPVMVADRDMVETVSPGIHLSSGSRG